MSNLFYVLIIANFFLGSCSNFSDREEKTQSFDVSISEKDRIWMKKFFHEFFLESTCIYTLFGTKPLAGKEITYTSEEDCKKLALLYLEKNHVEVSKKELLLKKLPEEYQKYDFHENWEKWIAFIEGYPNSPFLFAKHPTLNEKLWIGHILNVQEMVWTLQNHYNIFKKELGYDFDPISVTMDFKNPDSTFWKHVFSNHLLMGIAYGYGYKNSYFFNMYMSQPNQSIGDHSIFFSIDYKQKYDSNKLSLENLPLPMFRSFRLPFNDDPVLERYKLERKKIQNELTEENFFQKTLNQLTGSS